VYCKTSVFLDKGNSEEKLKAQRW